MIVWYGLATIAVSIVAAVIAVVVFARGRTPNDFTILPAAGIAVMLLVQVVLAIVAPFVRNPPVGDPLEFWLYLITALALPIGAGIWALVDRTKWANLVLAIMQLAVAVMVYRMLVIWLAFPGGV